MLPCDPIACHYCTIRRRNFRENLRANDSDNIFDKVLNLVDSNNKFLASINQK